MISDTLLLKSQVQKPAQIASSLHVNTLLQKHWKRQGAWRRRGEKSRSGVEPHHRSVQIRSRRRSNGVSFGYIYLLAVVIGRLGQLLLLLLLNFFSSLENLDLAHNEIIIEPGLGRG